MPGQSTDEDSTPVLLPDHLSSLINEMLEKSAGIGEDLKEYHQNYLDIYDFLRATKIENVNDKRDLKHTGLK
jgi:hypothetical protein